MAVEEEKHNMFWEIAKEVLAGFSLSSIGAIIAPELIHVLFIGIGGIVGTLAIHYTRKYLIPKFDNWMNKPKKP